MVKYELNGELNGVSNGISNGVYYTPITEMLFTNAVEHPTESLAPLKGKEYKMKRKQTSSLRFDSKMVNGDYVAQWSWYVHYWTRHV
jgi:hypothetical protein